ncbi:M20 family metallopeptidase [Virgibacillus sp. W0430]|uniref:M20 family metallopeptidase n=1 Tax=Virgibacillus sp. W0430 TaxID=3391580 RepID=UPI003F45ADC2
MLNKIHQTIEQMYPDMVEIRRFLHEHPELSFKEYKTAKYIANFYEELGIPYQQNVGGNGVVATLQGGKPGKTVALRADFDALPIQDEKDVPYKSKVDGVMHACGHDGHTATLLILAKALKQYEKDIPGTVVFLHQHAEELAPGGAKPIVESGALDNVDAVFGTHLWATTPVGELQTNKSTFMAGADRFEIIVKGKGGHGAYPHETKDAIVIGSQLVSQLQEIISRRLDPLKTGVITVGVFEAGTTFNIIADSAKIAGTVRYLEADVQSLIKHEMEKTIEGICARYDIACDFNYVEGYPPLINHEKETALVIEAGKSIPEIHTAGEVAPQMGGEDFAYYMMEKPGAYFFTGAKKEGHCYPHHHPKFDFDEKALPVAAKTLINVYFAYQEANK